MANAEFGTGKSLVVLAIVIGCFAILWPKIFYPMMQTAFAMTSPNVESESNYRGADRPPHLHPGSINPRLRNSIPSDVEDKFHMREGKPFPHPQARQPVKTQPKSGGAMSIIMPIYTVGIIVFFLYTVLKLVFKKPNEAEKKPLIKDFHMDPHYQKFMCDQFPDKKDQDHAKCESVQNSGNKDKSQDLDPKDYEIFKLKKKLEETEEAMNRIIKHMGAMSACLSEMDTNLMPTQNSEIRQRHKKHSGKGKFKADTVSELTSSSENGELLSDAKRLKLQKDLAMAMLNANKVSTKLRQKEVSQDETKSDYSDEGSSSENESVDEVDGRHEHQSTENVL